MSLSVNGRTLILQTVEVEKPSGVNGPSTSTANRVAVFADTDGDTIKEPDAAVDFNAQDISNVGTVAGHVPTTRQLIDGTGISGGGDLSADRTLSVDESALDPANMSSGAASAGQAPIADGLGGIAWDDAAASDQVRTLYVGKHGNDGNGGVNIDDAFLTVGAAITAATALTPTSANPVVIRILDSGTYTESITLPAYVSLDGPNAHLTYSVTSMDVIRANNGCLVKLRKVTCGSTNGYCITSDPNASGEVIFDIDEMSATGSGRLIGNRDSDTTLVVRARVITVTGVQRGAFESASNSPVVLDIEKIVLAGNTSYGILNLNSVPIKGRIGTIEKSSGSLTGTVGVVGGISPFSLVCGRIEADKPIDTPAGQTMVIIAGLVEGEISVAGTLYLCVGRHIGTITETGTLYQLEANGSLNRGLGVWGVTPPSSQPAHIADVTGTADGTYDTTEQNMLNDLKTAVNAINAVLAGCGLTAAS